MRKMIGAILILCTCTAMGYEKGKNLKNYLNELEELRRIFMLFQSELRYTRAPFAEIFLKLSLDAKRPFDEWLRWLGERLEKREGGTMKEVWKDSIGKMLRESSLRQEDMKRLQDVGEGLDYLETTELYREYLERAIEQTRKEYESKRKLYLSLGISGGVFLVIILI